MLRVLATVVIACAVASFAAGAWRDWRVRAHLPEPEIRPLPKVFTLCMAALLIAVSLPAAVLVWLKLRVSPPGPALGAKRR